MTGAAGRPANLGRLTFGGHLGECFLVARGKQHRVDNLYSATIYPSGKFEVAFQHMCTRAPFDDLTLREEFRQRLNRLPGVRYAAGTDEGEPARRRPGESG